MRHYNLRPREPCCSRKEAIHPNRGTFMVTKTPPTPRVVLWWKGTDEDYPGVFRNWE